MNLIGEKVILRAIEMEDLNFLKNMVNNPEIEKMVVGWSFPVSKETQEKWYNNQLNDKNNIRYIIEADGKKIGLASITQIDWKNRNAIIGIKLDVLEEIRNKGYGTDTIETLKKYSFEELQLNRLYCSILEYNLASLSLFQKCGFIKEGVLRKAVYKNNTYNDEIILSILKEEYRG